MINIFKKFFKIIKIIVILIILGILSGLIVDKIIFPNKDLIDQDNAKQKNNRIDINIIKTSNVSPLVVISLLKDPKQLCNKFSNFIHVNKKISCKSIKISKYTDRLDLTKKFVMVFDIEKGNGKAELTVKGDLQIKEIDGDLNRIIFIEGQGEIKIIQMPNFVIETISELFNTKIGGNFIYNLKLIINSDKNGAKINSLGYIDYGLDFMPTFVYMPKEIINRFANQIISNILDYVIKEI